MPVKRQSSQFEFPAKLMMNQEIDKLAQKVVKAANVMKEGRLADISDVSLRYYFGWSGNRWYAALMSSGIFHEASATNPVTAMEKLLEYFRQRIQKIE